MRAVPGRGTKIGRYATRSQQLSPRSAEARNRISSASFGATRPIGMPTSLRLTWLAPHSAVWHSSPPRTWPRLPLLPVSTRASSTPATTGPRRVARSCVARRRRWTDADHETLPGVAPWGADSGPSRPRAPRDRVGLSLAAASAEGGTHGQSAHVTRTVSHHTRGPSLLDCAYGTGGSHVTRSHTFGRLCRAHARARARARALGGGRRAATPKSSASRRWRLRGACMRGRRDGVSRLDASILAGAFAQRWCRASCAHAHSSRLPRAGRCAPRRLSPPHLSPCCACCRASLASARLRRAHGMLRLCMRTHASPAYTCAVTHATDHLAGHSPAPIAPLPSPVPPGARVWSAAFSNRTGARASSPFAAVFAASRTT